MEGRGWLLLLRVEGWCGGHVVVVVGFGAEGAECEVVDEDADGDYHYDENLFDSVLVCCCIWMKEDMDAGSFGILLD